MWHDLLQTEFEFRLFSNFELFHFSGDRQREFVFLLEEDVAWDFKVCNLKFVHLVETKNQKSFAYLSFAPVLDLLLGHVSNRGLVQSDPCAYRFAVSFVRNAHNLKGSQSHNLHGFWRFLSFRFSEEKNEKSYNMSWISHVHPRFSDAWTGTAPLQLDRYFRHHERSYPSNGPLSRSYHYHASQRCHCR